MIKLVYGSKNKIIKHGDKGFHALRDVIASNFPQAPADYALSYLDDDQDEICLNSDEDLVNMLNYRLKVYKVYIKQSLSQTVVLDLERSDLIEPSFEQTQSRVIKEENADKFGKPKEEEKRITEQVVADGETILQKAIENQATQTKEPALECPNKSSNQKIQSKDKLPEPLVQSITVEPQSQKVDYVHSEYVEVQSEEILIPKQEPKVIFDAAIQSQSVVIESEKKFEPTMMEVNAANMLFSDSLDVSAIRTVPAVYEQRVDVTRARIFSKVEQVRYSPKKQAEIALHEVICSNCKDEFGIIGIRYQCIFCQGYNLCSKCESDVEHEHSLVKVKKPQMAISRAQLIQKLRGQIYVKHVRQPSLPSGHYIPSVNKEDALRVIDAAKEAYRAGMERSQKLMEDVFMKMEMSHKNPYEMAKPVAEVVETVYDKAKYLQDLTGISWNEAQRFVTQYPSCNSHKVVEIYLQMKNAH